MFLRQRPVKPEPVKPGQESVWDYPRPAICQPTSRHIQIVHQGICIADTRRSIRTLETSHPPSYYIPPEHVQMQYLQPSSQRSFCEWKGQAQYFDVMINEQRLANAAWCYRAPTAAFITLRNHIAFYAGPFAQCLVDGEIVTPQAGDFYAGWITSHLAGPFKGGPGSRLW